MAGSAFVLKFPHIAKDLKLNFRKQVSSGMNSDLLHKNFTGTMKKTTSKRLTINLKRPQTKYSN